ncbi:MAG: carbohydrate binding family 9 domain-containing protein [Gemmatimonadetes bacterium]|nr:carbohydrate binding family 9 domain-containing protein [Gemmatimonadota bacterium]
MPLLLAQLAAASLLLGGGPHVGPVHSGRERALDVRLPRVDTTITVDGVLDEPVWLRAAKLTGFSRYAPSDGVPADDSTEVLVWYSATAIHFGIRAWAEPGTVRATLADRDKMYADDYIGIFIGTYNDGRQATVFGANPLGVQGDGIVVESGIANTQGFGVQVTGREATDISPDYVFQSKGRVTDFGYEIEIRIPFKSLSFHAADQQTWSLNVIRKVQSRGYEYSWAPALRSAPSYIAQHGHVSGLSGLDRGTVLDITPIVTSHLDGAQGPSTYGYGAAHQQAGGNVRWGITNNLTLSGTVNPDFAEVESDAGQFVTDPRQALFFTEKRPFFLEGAEQFSTPNALVYTRRILSPVAAAKITGKVAGTGVALLTALDDTPGSLTGTDRPFFTILRLSRDVGAGSRLGLLYTAKEEPAGNNRVLDLDGRFVLDDKWSARLQGALSRTERTGAAANVAPMWVAYLARNTRNLASSFLISGLHENFFTASGFISRGANAHASLNNAYTWFADEGSWWQAFTTNVVLDDRWGYQAFLHGRDALEKKLHFNETATLRGGWQVGASVLLEEFAYDPGLFPGYYVERHLGATVDTVPFVGRPRIPNTDWVFTLTSPEFKHFSFNALYVAGRDENFFEWSSADIVFATFGATWRPTPQVRVEGTYNWQAFYRGTDGSRVGEGRIPRVKLEYQLTRAIFFRLVGQYTSLQRDSLRDEGGTNFPILIRTGSTFARAGAQNNNSFRADALFSYQPSPGTVVFAGYGSTMTEGDPFGFRRLDRQADGLFVKMSYLFRL